METKLEHIWMILNKVEPVYYMIWKLIYMWPDWVRYAVEVLLLFCGFCVCLRLIKQVIRIFFFVLEKLVIGIICGIQYILARLSECAAFKYNLQQMDNRLNILGNYFVNKVREVQDWAQEKKLMPDKGRKIVITFFVILFFIMVLPEFQMMKSLDKQYQNLLCGVQNYVNIIEQKITPKINEYPDLFIEKEQEQEEKIEISEIRVQLNKNGKDGTNVRKGPSLDEESIMIVTTENMIIYLGERQYDGKRYWLKVKVDEEVMGWLSENLVEFDASD